MITLTSLAAERINAYLARRGRGVGIKVGVRTTGCSGLAYTLEYVDEASTECAVYESHGVKVFADPKSLVYINGMTMDWQKKGLNEGFDFINSNETGRCGCGESFKV
jgi:iron-sulfur cluster assembly protein